jgi:hypothetical protein
VAEDPFVGFLEDPDFINVSPSTLTVPLPRGVGADQGERRYLVYLGLFDLLTEQLVEEADTSEDAKARLRDLHGAVLSVEGPLRFALFEKGVQSESQDLRSRMRDRESAVTARWLVPRLQADIHAYRRRIEALERAVGDADG